MAEFSVWNEPGTGSDDLGLSLVVQFSGNKILQGYFTNAQNVNAADWERILDAFAAIPGCTYASLVEGKVTQRTMEPTRAYEPLPPPPMD